MLACFVVVFIINSLYSSLFTQDIMQQNKHMMGDYWGQPQLLGLCCLCLYLSWVESKSILVISYEICIFYISLNKMKCHKEIYIDFKKKSVEMNFNPS